MPTLEILKQSSIAPGPWIQDCSATSPVGILDLGSHPILNIEKIRYSILGAIRLSPLDLNTVIFKNASPVNLNRVKTSREKTLTELNPQECLKKQGGMYTYPSESSYNIFGQKTVKREQKETRFQRITTCSPLAKPHRRNSRSHEIAHNEITNNER